MTIKEIRCPLAYTRTSIIFLLEGREVLGCVHKKEPRGEHEDETRDVIIVCYCRETINNNEGSPGINAVLLILLYSFADGRLQSICKIAGAKGVPGTNNSERGWVIIFTESFIDSSPCSKDSSLFFFFLFK